MTPIAEVIERVAVPLARRKAHCTICQRVAAIEDVNARAFDEHGQRRRGYQRLIIDYLKDIGVPVSRSAVDGHVKHVAQDLAAPPRRVLPDRVTPLTPEETPATWYDVTEMSMGLGMEALRDLRARLPELDDDALIKVARLGFTAAGKRADLEARGRALSATIGALAGIASGHARIESGK